MHVTCGKHNNMNQFKFNFPTQILGSAVPWSMVMYLNSFQTEARFIPFTCNYVFIQLIA